METRPIGSITVGSRFRRDMGDLSRLAQSIREIGLLHPVVVNHKNELIAGSRRLAACKLLGWESVPITVVDLDALVRGEFEENVVRKDFTVSEIVAIKRAIEPEIKEEVQADKGGRPPKTGGKLPQVSGRKKRKPQTRDVVARYAGVSGRTLEKAEAIVDAAEADPERFGKVLENVNAGRTSVHYAYSQVLRASWVDAPPLPDGLFDVIYADPPWEYDIQLRGSAPYPAMDTEEIASMQVPSADDAVLFLWATSPNLPKALTVMERWGFEYRTAAVWVKDRIGTGFYFRARHEFLLLGTKGSPGAPPEASRPDSVVEAPRGGHSEKPNLVYGLIEQMYPGRRYLELFATRKRPGWTQWGAESDS